MSEGGTEMTTYTAEQIIRIGGKEWEKNGKHRVYLNVEVWTKLIGLETNHYNTGNIAGATLDGEPLSNSRARDILACISSVYLDVTNGEICIYSYKGQRYSNEVPGWIRDGIAEQVAATEPEQADDDNASSPAATTVSALRNAGRTVRQIAEMIGVSASTVYRWARGICQPRPANAAALAALA